jgi:hypothetical protein
MPTSLTSPDLDQRGNSQELGRGAGVTEEKKAAEEDPRSLFAEALKDARERAEPKKVTQVALAKALKTSDSTISRMEDSEGGSIPEELPAALDRYFGTDGVFQRLADQIRTSGFAPQYRKRMEVEPTAVGISEWGPMVVPGLLQTEGYARALLRAGRPRATEKEITRLVTDRMARQSVMRGPLAPDMSVVICESVIRRRIGGAEVMKGQLGVLLKLSAFPTVLLQVLPLSTGESGVLVDGSLSLLTLPDGSLLAYTEGIKSGEVIDDPTAVRRLALAYDAVRTNALPCGESAEAIRTAMEALP